MKFSEDFSADELYWIKEIVYDHIVIHKDYYPSEDPILSGATKMYDEIVKLIGED